jgi:hypothetical protein
MSQGYLKNSKKEGQNSNHQVSNVFKPDSQPPIGDDRGVIADMIIVNLFL